MLGKLRLARYSTRRSILSLVCLFAIALILTIAIPACGGGDGKSVVNQTAPDSEDDGATEGDTTGTGGDTTGTGGGGTGGVVASSQWGVLIWGQDVFKAKQ